MSVIGNHPGPHPERSKTVPLDDTGDRWYSPITRRPGSSEVIGIIFDHPSHAGTRCRGFVGFDVPANDLTNLAKDRPRWKVESWDPLTLSPSIRCTAGPKGQECGEHGWIREGRWVKA